GTSCPAAAGCALAAKPGEAPGMPRSAATATAAAIWLNHRDVMEGLPRPGLLLGDDARRWITAADDPAQQPVRFRPVRHRPEPNAVECRPVHFGRNDLDTAERGDPSPDALCILRHRKRAGLHEDPAR